MKQSMAAKFYDRTALKTEALTLLSQLRSFCLTLPSHHPHIFLPIRRDHHVADFAGGENFGLEVFKHTLCFATPIHSATPSHSEISAPRYAVGN